MSGHCIVMLKALLFQQREYKSICLVFLDPPSPLESLSDAGRDKYSSAQAKLAKLQTEKDCRHDEEMMQITQEIRSIQRELMEQELKDKKEQYRLERKKVEQTLQALQSNEVRMNYRILEDTHDVKDHCNYMYTD